jgi:hypothetical protein
MLLLFFWGVGPKTRLLLGFYTLAMAFALVYGGEHFVADIVAGWAMAGAAFAVVTMIFTGRRSQSATTDLLPIESDPRLPSCPPLPGSYDSPVPATATAGGPSAHGSSP